MILNQQENLFLLLACKISVHEKEKLSKDKNENREKIYILNIKSYKIRCTPLFSFIYLDFYTFVGVKIYIFKIKINL